MPILWSLSAATSLIPPSPSSFLRVQVLAKLTHLDDWTFNTFRLAELTNGKPLSTLAFAVLKQSGIVSCLKLDEHKLAR